MDTPKETEKCREGKHEDEHSSLNMINSQDINNQELETIRGDTIGNTVYSGRWIINTLMSISKISETGWSNDLENKFCMLWDMTAETDVILYLMENNFLEIAKYTLKTSTESRLTEIILGIIGNMCCNADVIDLIGKDKEFVETILIILRALEDTLSLIQLLRILKAVIYRIQINSQSDWYNHLKNCKFLGEIMIFILMSSTNDDLLKAGICLIQAMSGLSVIYERFMKELFKIDKLISALIESSKQFLPKKSKNYSETEIEFIMNLLTTLINLIKFELNSDDYKNKDYLKLMQIISKILTSYKHNLIPITEKDALLIHESIYIILCFQRNKVHVMPKLHKTITKIIFSLKKELDDKSVTQKIDPDEIIPELLDNLSKYWLEIIALCSQEEIIKILSSCEHNISLYLLQLVQSNSELSHDKLQNVQQAVASFQS